MASQWRITLVLGHEFEGDSLFFLVRKELGSKLKVEWVSSGELVGCAHLVANYQVWFEQESLRFILGVYEEEATQPPAWEEEDDEEEEDDCEIDDEDCLTAQSDSDQEYEEAEDEEDAAL